jgi:hypothetical protein
MSDVFEAMIFGKSKEVVNNEIEIKDTSIESFTLFLKFLYFEQFFSNDIKDHKTVIEVFKLSHRFQIKTLTDLLEEELVPMISMENIFCYYEFAMSYKLNKLLNAIKEFVIKNEKIMIETFENALIREPIETLERIVGVLKLTQKHLITALANIISKNPDKDWQRLKPLIKLDFCSVKDLNALRKFKFFNENQLNDAIEDRYEDLETRYEGLSAGYEILRAECDDKTIKYQDLSNKYVELNDKWIEMIAHYKEVKDIFGPFVDGVGGRVNQYVYNKTNCYLGKMNKKFIFKY